MAQYSNVWKYALYLCVDKSPSMAPVQNLSGYSSTVRTSPPLPFHDTFKPGTNELNSLGRIVRFPPPRGEAFAVPGVNPGSLALV
jgi:hypothetical protein